MEIPEFKAYNLTRQCFLGEHVVTGDFLNTIRRQWLPKLRPGSGFGLWMKPFRGISPEETQILVDLLYLDEKCCVIEAIESFPTYCVSPFSDTAASVLALPAGSIISTQTTAGDLLMIGPSEKMAGLLKKPSHSDARTGAVPAVLSSTDPFQLLSGEGPPFPVRAEPMQVQDRLLGSEGSPASTAEGEAPGETRPAAPGRKRSWLQRWLHPEPTDPRTVSRETAHGLIASFWTVGSPQNYEIRNLSTAGLYAVTDERWYPGTLLRITLTMPDAMEPQGHRSITVPAKAVRWGNDGVGFEFVLRGRHGKSQPETLPCDPVDPKELRRFLSKVSAARV